MRGVMSDSEMDEWEKQHTVRLRTGLRRKVK